MTCTELHEDDFGLMAALPARGAWLVLGDDAAVKRALALEAAKMVAVRASQVIPGSFAAQILPDGESALADWRDLGGLS